MPAAQCEIDHVVPFDHTDPLAGGWTVASNLQPLCAFHHQAKTMKLWAAAKLDGDSVFWTSRSGLRRITPSSFGTVMVPGNGVSTRKNKRTRTPRPTTPTGDPPDELYAPTWWETYIGEYSEYGDMADTDRAAYVPSLGDIARLTDPTARADAIFLRERFLEHRAVVTARERYRPPPF
ncbi:HNH endonuclease [Rhodococcoides fascians]|uniref:HNH endonuclease n=2 Tax=Rhodococcoides fascians TaxID=1828 RepID=UPI000AD841AB|nr:MULTISPECIES: HNH endonuclease signature motif containing protein [Rhodococcus]